MYSDISSTYQRCTGDKEKIMYGYGGGRHGGHHGHHGGHWGGPYAEAPVAPWLALDEQAVALHQAVAATFGAARQVAREGNAEHTAKAVEVLTEARKALYRLLAGQAE
jgi:hypothetical protein